MRGENALRAKDWGVAPDAAPGATGSCHGNTDARRFGLLGVFNSVADASGRLGCQWYSPRSTGWFQRPCLHPGRRGRQTLTQDHEVFLQWCGLLQAHSTTRCHQRHGPR